MSLHIAQSHCMKSSMGISESWATYIIWDCYQINIAYVANWDEFSYVMKTGAWNAF